MGILNYIAEQFLAIKLIDILDIAVVSILIYYIIKFIRDRRASKLALGVLMVLIVVIISDILDMRALKFLLSNIVQIGLISLIIIFQPELRSALEKMGGSPFRTIKNAGEQKSFQAKHTAINNICEAASITQAAVFMKDSLIPIVGEENMRREFPWDMPRYRE